AQRGPVDETSTGVPVDLQLVAQSTGLRTSPSLLEMRGPVDGLPATTPTALAPEASAADGAPVTIPKPGASPPGWFRRDATTLRYWNGNVFTDWRATWNGTRWVQSRETN